MNNVKSPRSHPQMRIGKREVPERPENLIKIGEARHTIKGTNMLVIELTENVVPYFTASIYGEGNRAIAGVHEIYGKLEGSAFCCLRIDEKLSAGSFAPGTVFKADKFRCLTYDRVKGASRLPSLPTNPAVPRPEVKRARSTKYRSVSENAKVVKYAEEQNMQLRRDFRRNKNYFLKKTSEKRGDYVKIGRKVTYTD